MRGSRLRHNIVGSEAGNPRPMAYMRRGHTRRARPRQFPWGRAAVIAGAAVAAIIWLIV